MTKLNVDENYHLRIHKDTNYVIFGDIDNCQFDILFFFNLLKDFCLNKYNLILHQDDFKYTTNSYKNGSHHYVIPKWNAKIENIKLFHKNFIDELDKNNKKCIDTTIYSEHWFRYPNQSKGNDHKGKHEIVNGCIKDFIIEHIPKSSINIDDIIENKKKNH